MKMGEERDKKNKKGEIIWFERAGDPLGIVVTLYSGTYYGQWRSCGAGNPTTALNRVLILICWFLFCLGEEGELRASAEAGICENLLRRLLIFLPTVIEQPVHSVLMFDLDAE